MILKVRFDGKVFVPDQPVDLPAGSMGEVSVQLERKNQAKRSRVRLSEIADQFPADPDLPIDGAEQLDHYLYGTPKRANP